MRYIHIPTIAKYYAERIKQYNKLIDGNKQQS